MTSSCNRGLADGRPFGAARAASPGRPPCGAVLGDALLSLAAVASVLTAGCAPIGSTGHSTGITELLSAGRLTFAPAADAFVYSNPSSNTNTGSSAMLVASPMQDQGTASYLKFVVSGVPAGRYVTSAHLVLHRVGDSLPSTVNIATSSSNWSELAINAGNAPAIGPPSPAFTPAKPPRR